MSNTCTYVAKGPNRNVKMSGWMLFIATIFRKAPILMCKMLVMVRCSVLAQFDCICPALRASSASPLGKMRPPCVTPFAVVVALRAPVGWCFVIARTEEEGPALCSLPTFLVCWC